MTWAKSWGLDEWEFEDLCDRHDPCPDPDYDDDTLQTTILRRRGATL